MSRSGLDNVGDDIDLSGFEAKKKPATTPAQAQEPVQRAARAPRIYRTGRSETIAVKTTPDAAATFYALADRLNLKVGETFERAVEALAREAGRQS
jgi:hypothetical protein